MVNNLIAAIAFVIGIIVLLTIPIAIFAFRWPAFDSGTIITLAVGLIFAVPAFYYM